MKSQLFSQSSQPRLSPPPPRPLQLLAECSLRDLLPRSHDIRPIPSAERDRVPYYQPYLSQYTRLNYQNFNYGGPEKRKFSQAMDGPGLQPNGLHDQIQQDQHQQQKEVNSLPWTSLASTTKDTNGEQKSGLTTLICAAESSPEASTTTPDPRSSIIPATGKIEQKATSICSASSSCCDDDDCSSKCEDEDCDAPACEDCTACEIVPQFCDSESCLEQSSSCPEDASCVQKIICAKDDCEVTSCHPSDCVFGNGDIPGFDVPLWSVPLGGFAHQQPQNHNRNQDRNQHQNQHQSGSVEPNLLSLDYGNPDQLQDLQLHYPLPAQQLIHYPISQPNLASEPSESSRSSSAFLEPYNEFSSTFDHDYAAPSKRRRVSQTTPITSPAYEYPSKPSTPFSTAEPVQNWPNYNPTNNENWNNGMLFNTNPANSNNLMDLNDCHWDGCNFHFASEVDFQMHLSTHLGELTPEQCLWDACGTSVDGLEDLKEHLAVHLLPPDVDSSTRTSPAPTIDDGGPKRCEWLVSTGKNVSSSGEEELVRCGKTFASAEELQKHAKDEHIAILKKKTGHFCGWADCSRRNRPFSQKGKVERHLQTHTGFKSCKCTFCNKEFSAAQALQQHIRTHTGEKPYKCDVCFKEFAQGSALTMHKRVHTGDRPLKCEFPGCGKRFSESSNLSKHRKTHLSVGQHRCGFAGCERTFHRLDQMKRHQKVHGNFVSLTSNDHNDNNPLPEESDSLNNFLLQPHPT